MCVSPEEVFQLTVQVSNEGATCDDLSMAVVKGQSSITHVLPIYTLGSCGDANHLSILHIRT